MVRNVGGVGSADIKTTYLTFMGHLKFHPEAQYPRFSHGFKLHFVAKFAKPQIIMLTVPC